MKVVKEEVNLLEVEPKKDLIVLEEVVKRELSRDDVINGLNGIMLEKDGLITESRLIRERYDSLEKKEKKFRDALRKFENGKIETIE